MTAIPSPSALARRNRAAGASYPVDAIELVRALARATDTTLAHAPHLRVEVPGPPIGKGRPRVYVDRKNTLPAHALALLPAGHPLRASAPKGQARAVTPDETRAYEAHVRELAQLAGLAQRYPAGGWRNRSVRYVVRVYAVIEADTFDIDNICKSLCDGLNKIAYPDDRRIQTLLAHRRVAEHGELPHANVDVWALGPTGARS